MTYPSKNSIASVPDCSSQQTRCARHPGLWASLVLVSLCLGTGVSAQEETPLSGLEIVSRIRDAWGAQGRTVERYEASVRERWSAYIPMPLGDRLAYRREVEAEIEWHREGPRTVDLLGARALLPLLGSIPDILPGYRSEALDIAFDPDEARRTIGIGNFRLGRHPVLPGNTDNYAFSVGDTTALRLPGGREIQLVEVRVRPKSEDGEVLGSMWVDPDSWQLVREVYRRRPERATGEGAAIPLVGDLSFELNGFAIDYALWEGRWWMPRVVTLEGMMALGRLGSARLVYRRAYSDYRVEGRPSQTQGRGPQAQVEWGVTVPDDLEELLSPPSFPQSMLASDSDAMGAALLDLREVLPSDVWDAPLPAGDRIALEFPRLDLIRFNRVEGLSMGARLLWDRGVWSSAVEAGVGTSARGPTAVISVSREVGRSRFSAEAFRRVSPMDDVRWMGGPVGSLAAALVGRDEAEYYQSVGGTVTWNWAARGGQGGFDLRSSFEQQRGLDTGTDNSLPSVWSSNVLGRPNLRAAPADQFGAEFGLWLRGSGDDVIWRVDARVEQQRGDFRFGRVRVRGQARAQLSGPLWVDFEGAAGDSWGSLPPQALFLLGGSPRIAGYDPTDISGRRFWRGRTEFGIGQEGVSLLLFGHAGRATGSASPSGGSVTRYSVGVGVEAMGGLVRLDGVRALSFPTGWRLGLWTKFVPR